MIKYTVYGIGFCRDKNLCSWYPSLHEQHNNNVNLTEFCQKECQIDMKLDCDREELSFCLLENNGNTKIRTEAVINNLGLRECNGFVPYFNSYENVKKNHLNSVGTQIKIAKCPISWYGRYKGEIFKSK